ncbi:MAG TPA: head GIN domain-containing protein [Flavobacteriaceae bacterium]|nr:head GIN domain-containing protein [Flavobacteriaceae bacterium]
MKYSVLLFCVLLFWGCEIDKVTDCFQAEGKSISSKIDVPHFDKVLIYENVKVFIEKGPVQEVIVKTGENLLDNVQVSVEEKTLILKNESSCNLFRDYKLVEIYVTSPNITEIRNAGQWIVESVNTLTFPNLTLLTENFNNKDFHTNGGFRLQLDCEELKITSNGFSIYFLSGKVEHMFAGFYASDGRLEASDLIVQKLEFFHRSSNKLIVNPQQSLKGEIRSTGDVISKNHPPIVEVEEFYTGRLIFP